MLMINEVYRFCSVLEVISSKENEKGKRAKKEKEKKKKDMIQQWLQMRRTVLTCMHFS